MRITIKIASALLFSLASSTAFAFMNYYTGQGIIGMPELVRMGYIAGVVDSNYGRHELETCIPKGATIGQLTSVVDRYLRAHPESWHLTGESIARFAIQEAFHC